MLAPTRSLRCTPFSAPQQQQQLGALQARAIVARRQSSQVREQQFCVWLTECPNDQAHTPRTARLTGSIVLLTFARAFAERCPPVCDPGCACHGGQG